MNRKAVAIFLTVLALVTIACATLVPPSPAPSPTSTAPSIPFPTSPSTPDIDLVMITVYFTDENLYAGGTPPFEVGVTRIVPASPNLPEAVLRAFFEGPTIEESREGLVAVTSGFDGLDALVIQDGIAHVYLTGRCASMGATYTVAQPVMKNLLQFPEISYVKIYDENGETEEPQGESNSIPFCLEP